MAGRTPDQCGELDISSILPPCGVGFEDTADFVADTAEDSHLFLVAAFGMSRVVEAPVVTIDLPGEHGAHLIRIAADGDHRFHVLAEELIEVLRVMRGDVDTDLLHGSNRQWVDIASRLGAGAGDADNAVRSSTEDAFGQMAAA